MSLGKLKGQMDNYKTLLRGWHGRSVTYIVKPMGSVDEAVLSYARSNGIDIVDADGKLLIELRRPQKPWPFFTD